MRASLLLLAAAAALPGPAAASKDILLTPPHTGGIPVGVVAIEGAQIPVDAYVPLMRALQNATAPDYSLYVSLPAFLLDCPNPPQIAGKIQDAQKALAAAMPSPSSDASSSSPSSSSSSSPTVVGFAHSLGAVFLQDYVFSHPTEFSAQILTGAGLGRKYRNGSAGDGIYPVPTLALDGTLDGLYRATRQAEGYFHQVLHPPANAPATYADDFPVVSYEGVTHMQFASGTPPSNVAKNDLKPEVSYDEAHTMLAAVMAEYLRGQLGGAGVDQASARAAVAKDVAATGTLFAPLVAALQQEGHHHFAPPCNSDYQMPARCPAYPRYPSNNVARKAQDPGCTCGVPFSAVAQSVMAGPPGGAVGVPDFTVVSADAIHNVDEITPVHLPHIWHNCTGGNTAGSCTVNVTTVTQAVYATLDGLDTGFYYQSASELRVKLKSRQAVLLAAGAPASAVDFNTTDLGGYNCAVINNASYTWALEHAGDVARARFERIGEPLVMGEDIFLSNAGPAWIWNPMKYQEAKDKSQVVVRAPCSHTPVDYSIKAAAGYHYCKVLSPARAMEWVYIDGLRAKGGLH